ncbi:hypothetical protein OAA03_00650 [bacterium]|nr:hypothetical protein [bacterium]|tara:strand:- start:1330 stop:2538 length:1209 start_codon:yes stop_codon:yes gene_type:complete
MARRVKPKISYKKNKKTPKAFVGAATMALGAGKAIFGGIQARRAKKAEKGFDKSRLETKVSSATQKMADQPIDQGYIEQMQGQQAADRASAMGALAKDPRNALAGVQALEAQAGKQRTELMGMQQQAKTRAMENLAAEQRAVGQRKADIAGQELAGIRSEKAAGQQNIFGGAEDIASGIGAGGIKQFGSLFSKEKTTAYGKEGAKIGEDGGVTPGKFSHEENPIDMVQDGEKVGEATGGELILPPDDVNDIREALQSEDKDAAFDLMKDLVAKYDDNVIGDDDSEAQEGGKVEKPTVPPLNQDRAQEIVKVMKGNADQVRNVGELPFDEDPTNPAGLVKYIGDKLSFDIDSTSKAEIDFIKNYREFLLKDKGRADAPQSKMMGGGYLSKVKARVGAYMKSKY